MKNRKQLCWIAGLLLMVIACVPVYAQDIRLGIRGGIGESTLPLKVTQNNQSITLLLSKAGFRIGMTGDYEVNEQFSVQSELQLVTKGGELPSSTQSFSVKLVQTELPVYFLYHHEGFFMGAGPCFTYGFTAKSRLANTPEVDLYKDTSMGLPGVKFKRFEIGASAQLGYEFPSGFTINAYYVRGLTNVSTNPGIIDVRNRMYGISIGYFFRPRKAIIVKK